MNPAEQNNNIYERPNHFVFLNTFREQNELCDVTIKVGNKEIRAHRLILAATINYFHRMFSGDFEESRKDVISIDNISAEHMEAIITFSYTGKIAFTKDNAVSLLKIADFFELTDVKDKCMEFLKLNLETENVCEVSYFAKLLRCSSLLERSKTFIRQNLQDVSLTDGYRNLEFEFFKSILSGTEEYNISAELMFEVIMRWISEEVDSKIVHLSELLCHVSLSDISAEFLVSSLANDEFRIRIGPKHSELVAEVLSILNRMKINNIKKKSKTYIYVEYYSSCIFVEIYDFTTDEWNLITFERDLLPVITESLFTYKDKLYRLPWNPGKAVISVLSFKDKVWIDTSATIIPFDTRSFILFGTAVLDDCLYVCGGGSKIPFKNEFIGKNDVWRFSIETCTWKPITPMKQSRVDPQIVTLQKCIYAIGGCSRIRIPKNPTIMTMERYDPLTDQWTVVSDLGVEAESYDHFGAVGINDKIYLCGGTIDGEPSALFQAYDLKTNKWIKLASMNTVRYAHFAVEYKGKIWAIGGRDATCKCLSSVEVYDLVSDSWIYGKPMSKLSGPVRGCLFSSSSC